VVLGNIGIDVRPYPRKSPGKLQADDAVLLAEGFQVEFSHMELFRADRQ
jgi:hypothetical protein